MLMPGQVSREGAAGKADSPAEIEAASPPAGRVAVDDLVPHMGYLHRYALATLRDGELAREAVQETLVAAIEGLPSFAGRATVRSWLTSILRHKIVDLQRERARRVATDEGDEEDEEAFEALLFNADGQRVAPVEEWRDPERALERRQFWEAFERCVEGLPKRAAQMFALREILGESIESICKIHGVSATNCSVILHRARVRLRECLSETWFRDARG
ncbi:MAG: RNA polymerase sigma factor [Burkholderiales bacterium]|nr:MAG: RNA polymerase sigma factor [Burkholderiales bacterium]